MDKPFTNHIFVSLQVILILFSKASLPNSLNRQRIQASVHWLILNSQTAGPLTRTSESDLIALVARSLLLLCFTQSSCTLRKKDTNTAIYRHQHYYEIIWSSMYTWLWTYCELHAYWFLISDFVSCPIYLKIPVLPILISLWKLYILIEIAQLIT